MTTAATSSDLKVHIRAHYAGHQPLADGDVHPKDNGQWMAYPVPELTDVADRREFWSVVARAKQRFHHVTPD